MGREWFNYAMNSFFSALLVSQAIYDFKAKDGIPRVRTAQVEIIVFSWKYVSLFMSSGNLICN